MLSAIKSNQDLPGVRTDFSKDEVSNGWHGIFSGTGLCVLLEEKDYRALEKVFIFIAAFVDRSAEHYRTAAMVMVHTRYSEPVTDVREI